MLRLRFDPSAGPRVAMAKSVVDDAIEDVIANYESNPHSYAAMQALLKVRDLLRHARFAPADDTPRGDFVRRPPSIIDVPLPWRKLR